MLQFEFQGSAVSGEAAAAMKKLQGQLWYLNENVVSLAFFDNEVSADEKRKMVLAMKSVPGSATQGWRGEPKDIEESTSLADLVNENSKSSFNILEMDDSFLQRDPENWTTNTAYISGLRVVKS